MGNLSEQIAEQINEIAHSWDTDIKPYKECPDLPAKYGKSTWLNYADKILALIKEAGYIKPELTLLSEKELAKFHKVDVSEVLKAQDIKTRSQTAGEIISEFKCLVLAPNDDAYFRILVERVLKDIKSRYQEVPHAR